MTEAGARLVSVEDNFDGTTPMGRFAIGILTLIAESELERIQEGWETAVRGRSVAGRAHFGASADGLQRDDSGRLVREEPAASVIRRHSGDELSGRHGPSWPNISSWRACTHRPATRTGRRWASLAC